MTIAFVLGNGQSRKDINPATLKEFGVVYGCNALYRSFVPDYLVATDQPIAQRIQESGYALKNQFYTRRPLPDMGAKVIPKKYFGNSSGPVATALAALNGHTRIYLVGFDMGPSASNKFNNMYADTEFYKSSKDNPTYTFNWIKQLQTICRDFPTTHFFRVMGDLSAPVPELTSMPNMNPVPMERFIRCMLDKSGF